MKFMLRTVLLVSLIAVLLTACGMPAGTANQDMVNTAVAGTQVSQALAQATVNSTVLTAMPATPTPGPTVEYVTLTEEELAALIDQAVTEAVTATEQATTAVTTTTTDSAVTSEEVVYVYDYYYYADYYVEYAEDLLAEYYNLYGDLANEMITELSAIESELSQLNDTLTSIDSSLQEISSTLSQGLAAAEESIAQLESAAQQAQTNAAELQTQAQDMLTVLQADQQGRVDQLAQIQANNIPTDKLSALQSTFSFVDAANAAMSDNKLSRDELLNLAQLGKNAQSGLQSFGGADRLGPDITQFSGKFDEITTQFARGQMPQARSNLGQFETSLGNRPDFSGAGGNLPSGPGGPGPRP
jgi:DNA repair exonuclease SbcCD ATPase subunit